MNSITGVIFSIIGLTSVDGYLNQEFNNSYNISGIKSKNIEINLENKYFPRNLKIFLFTNYIEIWEDPERESEPIPN